MFRARYVVSAGSGTAASLFGGFSSGTSWILCLVCATDTQAAVIDSPVSVESERVQTWAGFLRQLFYLFQS